MKVDVSGVIEPGVIGEMSRAGDKWEISVGDELVFIIPDSPMFKPLKRDSYRLLGLEDGSARVIRFADLHRHSDNSLLDGMTQVKEMVKKTEYAGALTDHGNMYGFVEYYKGMKAAGKHPIIGFEGYMESMNGSLEGRHVILLAKNHEGLQNLYKLTSESFDHFYRKPHVTWQMLEQYHEGVICLTACLGGIIPTALKKGDVALAKQAIERFISIFGKEDFYVELQRHFIKEEDYIRPQLLALAKEYGLKVVATTDSHYPNIDDAYVHEVLLCLQTEKTMDDSDRMRYDGSGYHLMTSEEMEQLFHDIPEALDNTLEVAEKCNVEIKFGDVNLPKYTIPEQFASPMDYVRSLAQDGFQTKFAGTPHLTDPVYQERLDYELNMIERMGFASYFIIVWDFINFARTNNIYVGPGRGSAAGSLAAYCLGITDLDPIKYNLLFERFLNPERVSWPDIDSDFEYSRRPEVIKYMTQKYGEENVCRIITFGTLGAKQVVRDVSRCLGMPASYSAKLSGYIPKDPQMTIEKALELSTDLYDAYISDANAHKIIDIAKRLEGNKRHASQHACGVCVSPSAVSNFLPTSMEIDKETKQKSLTTQVTKDEVEELSLIKMDLLGLKNMGVIHEVIDRVPETRGLQQVLTQIKSTKSELRYQDIPLDDRKVYQMLASGMTGGVFQLESEGMTNLIKDMFSDIDTLPDDRLHECFERLIAAVALYRPGPMDYIPNYIAGMRDESSIVYLTPELEEILKPTYGTIVYQEQVMQIVQKLAGYTLGRADLVRKAMGKKKHAVMEAEKQVFLYGNKEAFDSGKDKVYTPGCINNGIPESVAQEVWAQMANFASYAFNRSHAACYAYIACITAYMSCYWPEEYYAALLNAFIDKSDKVKIYLNQASKRGIKLLSPHINNSACTFRSEPNSIRFGLQGIAGLKSAATDIVEERAKNGPFANLEDLYFRMADKSLKLNKKSIDGLVYSGALAPFSTDKRQLLSLYSAIEKAYKTVEKDRKAGQLELFSDYTVEYVLPKLPKLDEREEMDKEFASLGIYLTKHPADYVLKTAKLPDNYIPLESLPQATSLSLPFRNQMSVGLLQNLRIFYTKRGQEMCTFTASSRFATISCVVFPSDFPNVKELLRENSVVGLIGNMSYDESDDRFQFVINELKDEETLIRGGEQPIMVEIMNKTEQEIVLDFIRHHHGPCPVCLQYGGKVYPLKAGINPTTQNLSFLQGGFRNL